MTLAFQNAQFLTSVVKSEKLPELTLPEIALVGRSNVGKSSLINYLLHKKGLARVSSTPGKTQMLNFFSVDEKWLLVDLPGYGYSKSGKNLRASWSLLIENYLSQRKTLSLIVFLLDLRHLPSKDDIAFAKWAHAMQRELLIVFTKADKLNKSKVALQAEQNLNELVEKSGIPRPPFLTFSIKDAQGRTHLTRKINGFLYGTN